MVRDMEQTSQAPRLADAPPQILVVDDDREIRRMLSQLLKERGFRAVTAANTSDARRVLAEHGVDLVVLDVMMPGGGGLELCRSLRAESAVPIILLTALGEEADRVVGLELGADDYVVKPFSSVELIARIRAALRRFQLCEGAAQPRAKTASFEGWTLDFARRELLRGDGVLVDLTSGEFTLLAALIARAGRVLSRASLLDLTQDRDADAFDRSIDVLVSRLRAKLDDPARAPRLIKTVHAVGYVFAAPVEMSDG